MIWIKIFKIFKTDFKKKREKKSRNDYKSSLKSSP